MSLISWGLSSKEVCVCVCVYVCVCVCVSVHAHAREKGLRHMGRAHEDSCGQIHQHSPFFVQNVVCPQEENHFCKEVFV